MRKAFVILFAALVFTPALFAKSKHDWECVEKLKSGTPVLISLWTGRLVSGSVDAVGPDAVRIDTADPEFGVGSLIDFSRADIRRIVRIRRPNLPDVNRWLLTGVLVGGAIGLTAGAIDDIAHHQNYNWFIRGLGGAGVGFLGSCAILAGFSVVELLVEIFHHHGGLVYEDENTGKMRTN
jgi:hypothetical protein